jgi:hypothetical protein
MAKSNRSQKKSFQKKQNGGQGAADHAIAVFGNVGQQHAGENNVIAMNNVNAVPVVAQAGGALVALSPASVVAPAPVVAVADAQKGGAQLALSPALVGGNIINDVAVPAAFILANSAYKKMRKSSKRSAKRSLKRNKKSFSKRR